MTTTTDTATATDRPTALVLGASVGVGAAIAKRLLRDGYRVIGFHRGRHREEALKSFCLSANMTLVEMDVGSSFQRVHDGLDAVSELTNSVNVVVHSLSGARFGHALDMMPLDVEKTFNNLAHSFLWWVKGLIDEEMLGPGARIVALSNPCGDLPLRNGGVIGAAKAALEAYVRSLAMELGPRGMRVNAVQFGTVLTPAVQRLLVTEKMADLHTQIVPVGRLCTADDVANFVAALVGPDCAWLNGAVLDATGGMLLTLLDYAYESARN